MAMINLSGMKFNMLKVLDTYHVTRYKAGTKIKWDCVCDCGKQTLVDAWKLKSGHTKSCGCIHKFESGEASFNHLYGSYQIGAKNRNLIFELDKDHFRKLTKQNCSYCGLEPNNEFKSNVNCTGSYFYNGVDRVNNKIGYTIENSVTCCTQCNQAKMDYSEQEYLEWLERLIKNYDNIKKRMG